MYKNLLLIVLLVTVLNSCVPDSNRNINDIENKKKETSSILELQQQLKFTESFKNQFILSWDKYKRHAYGHDKLMPITGSYLNNYGQSLLFTPLAAFPTLVMFGFKEESKNCKKLILTKLNFNKYIYVKIADLSNKVLIPLLSAYQISRDEKFLILSVQIGNIILEAYNTESGLPYSEIDLVTRRKIGKFIFPSDVGSSFMALTILSKITNNPVYYKAPREAMQKIFDMRFENNLIGSQIDIENETWNMKYSHTDKTSINYYEALLKTYLLTGEDDLRQMWEIQYKAIDSILVEQIDNKYWMKRIPNDTINPEIKIMTNAQLRYPGLLALGNQIYLADKYIPTIDTIIDKFGIEPLSFNYENLTLISKEAKTNSSIIETLYYLYIYTKNSKYRELAIKYFNNYRKTLYKNLCYKELADIETKQFKNSLNPDFFSTTLKYLYLMYNNDNIEELQNIIFTSEGHPIKITWD